MKLPPTDLLWKNGVNVPGTSLRPLGTDTRRGLSFVFKKHLIFGFLVFFFNFMSLMSITKKQRFLVTTLFLDCFFPSVLKI